MHAIIIPGFTPVDDPAAQPWLEEAERHATALSTEIFGAPCPQHVLIVHLAASVLWRESDGAPCWSQLDLAVLDEHLASTTWWSIVGDDAPLQLEAFIEHLARRGILDRVVATAVQRRLRSGMHPALARLLSLQERSRGPAPRGPSYCLVPTPVPARA